MSYAGEQIRKLYERGLYNLLLRCSTSLYVTVFVGDNFQQKSAILNELPCRGSFGIFLKEVTNVIIFVFVGEVES